MLPDAPARLSTTTCCPSSSVILGWMMRPTKSDEPPGANGMIMRTAGSDTPARLQLRNTQATERYHESSQHVASLRGIIPYSPTCAMSTESRALCSVLVMG